LAKIASYHADMTTVIDTDVQTASVEGSAERPLHETIEIAPPATLSAIWEDLLIHTPERLGRPWPLYILRLMATVLLSSGFHMVTLYRIGAFCYRLRLLPLCVIIEKIIYHWYHCLIPCSVRIGKGLWVVHPMNIILNRSARLGKHIWLRQGVEIVHIPPELRDKTGLVGDGVKLHTGAVLTRGAIVGHGATVAARALVNKPIPPGYIAMGIPAEAKPRPWRKPAPPRPRYR
jgi:serine acetyltransferase